MIIPLLVTACSGPLSILDPAGTAAAETAPLWWGMFGFFTLVLFAVVLAFVYAVRRTPRSHTEPGPDTSESDTPQLQRQHQVWIVGGGIVLPVATIVTLLVFGIPAGNRMAGVGIDPDQALHIEVTGYQWWWEVRYPNLSLTLRDEVHIPAGVPVRLHLTSADVIHSFWVPRIGQKLDMIPGHVNELLLQADAPGIYPGVCAEFCGLAHAHMKFSLHVHSPEDFAAWQTAQQPGAAE
ncbi:MAG: cytochrome c oxidase subunit II [Pseudohongiella sp.]|nr:cytochrome c oxidase subunit II [Pseudohongiella sp.]MDO9521016.1 cytochrome c oxidase subunit II [Pseudohongiella sp.]